ncbi:Trimeric GatFAB AmidoTransferase(AdT) complex subunit [Steccherinum ochraceum]|uniref:Glutamyl-tRNA(Gln) amidotransferase subunit A, mitochondrial n=1 Tax=Steccherinum ochraceum TaxID=92696 RepID=A0A4R0RHL9_9APHY|nr:Trimeric GatFAB AmidoTransferase(AdT) complex subunit [Steccherinum ochraceum]
MLEGFRSPFDATVVELLQRAGARIIGKANCDEFGMGSLNLHSAHGAVVNPHQPPSSSRPWEEREQRSAGGSSGGSAAAVAASMAHVALGTDTGGSVRLPASYCGVVGFKPSYGILSRWGIVSYADSLDCVGLLGRDTTYVGQAFDVLSQYDHKDPSAATPDTRQKAVDALNTHAKDWNFASSLQGLRIGVPQEYFPSELDRKILKPFRSVVDILTSLGASVIPVNMPSTPYALSAYYVIASAEASSNLARYDGIQYGLRVEPPPGSDLTKTSKIYAHTRSQGFGSEVRKRILLGTYALTADAFDNYFLQAQRLRQLVRQDFDNVFRMANPLKDLPPVSQPDAHPGVDVLLHPSAIRTAPHLPSPADEADSSQTDSLPSYVQDVLTVPASLAGVPAISVPAGLAEDGWPVGVSVVSQWGCDKLVLDVAKAIEQHIPPSSS